MRTNKHSFTLMELLIIVGVIAVLGAAAIALINPAHQIHKAWDARRKRDLDTLKKVLEDYYNDKGCYPKPEDICYTTPVANCKSNQCKGVSCYICGNEPGSPSFPYLTELPCDPQHSRYKYMYQVEGYKPGGACNDSTCTVKSCPSWYRIYSELSAPWVRETDDSGCGEGGCGVDPNWGYDYGVTSPNTNVQATFTWGCWINTPSPQGTCENRTGYEFALDDCNEIFPNNNDCCLRSPRPDSC